MAGDDENPKPANLFHGLIPGSVLPALTVLLGKWGGWLNPAWLAVAALLVAACGFAFPIMQQRYAAILVRKTAHQRRAYTALRESLATGGLATRTYERWLTVALAKLDGFLGDAGQADRSLWPHAFGLRKPMPLWTPASFDRCLQLALLYPIATIFVFWVLSGHVGPAEHALGLARGLGGWRRTGTLVALVLVVFSAWRIANTRGWAAAFWSIAALAGAVVVAVAGAAVVAVAGAAVVAVAGAGAGAGAVAVAVGFVGAVGGAVAVAFAGAVAVAVAGAGAFAGGVIGVIAVVVVAGATVYLNDRSIRSAWRGMFQIFFLLTMTLMCFAAAATLASSIMWKFTGPILLFLVLLTLINAPFDWASLGLTRALLRRGLEGGGWWPWLLALADAAIAGVIVIPLTIVSVISVQAFDTLAALAGGAAARILPLSPLFDGIEADPWAAEYRWVYAMLLSTMLPSMANLMIGSAALLRGVPWLRLLLLRFMPVRGTPAPFDRRWMSLLLTAQIFFGFLLGIGAQAFIAYAVIAVLLPLFGWDLLDLARSVAAADLPGYVVEWFRDRAAGG